MIYETNINEEAIFTKSHKNPVFIVLSSGSSLFAKGIKKVTNSEFSHAMISFNSKLDPLYSFGTREDGKLGFVINNTKSRVWDIDDCKYSVYIMFVTDKAKANMKKTLQYFIDKKDELKYDFSGIIDIWRNKPSDDHREAWFCSRFVMELISKAQSLSKSASLWKPKDILDLDNISIVNRGFNLFNYDHKVTDRHVKDIIKGSYNPGDVIYESSSTYEKYIVDGNYDYLENQYVVMYRESYYKIPKTGYPCSSKEAKEIEEAAKKAASAYYTFKVSDSNRNYPFKFFNILDIDKNKYMKLINGNVPLSKRIQANLYHVNIKDSKKKISIILIATKQQVYSTYLLLNNSVLLKFNYEGIMYQEQTVKESTVDDTVIDRQYNQDAAIVNTAKFINTMIKKEQLKGCLVGVTCSDIEANNDGWIYANYKINGNKDRLQIKDFIRAMNKMIETSPNYTGVLKEPDNLDNNTTGSLYIYKKEDEQLVSKEESTVDEKSLKFYVNPARQLKVKNTKKRNDQVNKGNYTDLTSTLPDLQVNKKESPKG